MASLGHKRVTAARVEAGRGTPRFTRGRGKICKVGMLQKCNRPCVNETQLAEV
jgi:hypothetical protein